MAKKRRQDWRPEGVDLIERLSHIAPSIAISTHWEVDRYFRWDGDGPDPAEEGYFPYDVDVVVRTIVKGKVVEGTDNLGGVYSKPDDKDPDVHGYFSDLLEDALVELKGFLSGDRKREVEAAIKEVKAVKSGLYNAQ